MPLTTLAIKETEIRTPLNNGEMIIKLHKYLTEQDEFFFEWWHEKEAAARYIYNYYHSLILHMRRLIDNNQIVKHASLDQKYIDWKIELIKRLNRSYVISHPRAREVINGAALIISKEIKEVKIIEELEEIASM